MKRCLAIAILTLILNACCTQPCGGPCWKLPASQYSVVNNSGVNLAVYQDGAYMGDLPLGGVLPLHGTLFWQNTVVTVVGHDAAGNHVGSASWTFVYSVPEAWTVTCLTPPVLRR